MKVSQGLHHQIRCKLHRYNHIKQEQTHNSNKQVPITVNHTAITSTIKATSATPQINPISASPKIPPISISSSPHETKKPNMTLIITTPKEAKTA
mmetsp:Transcript_27313/g.31516  ORF Transcript_27313/g.31516 Transcript_27313/m.31516 type:complete len:95 (-) Transcript_27313:399-683(-)